MGFLAGSAEQLEKGQSWNGNGYHGGKGGKDGGKNQWQQGSGTIGSQGQEKGEARPVGRVKRQDTEQRGAEKEATIICVPLKNL